MYSYHTGATCAAEIRHTVKFNKSNSVHSTSHLYRTDVKVPTTDIIKYSN